MARKKISAVAEENQEADPGKAAADAMRAAGAAQAFRVSGIMNDLQAALVIREVHDTQSYRALGQTWTEYCEHTLGMPVSSVYELLDNIDKLGERFLLATEHLGLSRTTYRALRRLPESERPKLLDSGEIEVAGQKVPLDKKHREQVKDLIEDLVSRASALEERIDEGEQQLEQQDEQLTEQGKEIKRLKKEISDLRRPHVLPDGITEFDRQCVRILGALSGAARMIQEAEARDEDIDRGSVMRWIRRIQPALDQIGDYGRNLKPFVPDPDLDYDAAEELMQEFERADREDSV